MIGIENYLTITALRYIINICFQISSSHDVVDMHIVANIEVQWVWTTFRTRPEWLTYIKENVQPINDSLVKSKLYKSREFVITH